MIDWSLVARIVVGGFGVSVLVLVILAMVVWLAGIIIQKATKENSGKA